jgi:hypothetical protein
MGLNFSRSLFRLPVGQVKVFFYLSALIAVLERLLGLMFHFTERVVGVTNDLGDGFHHFFPNAFYFGYGAFAAAQAFPYRWPESQLPYTLRL